MTVAPRSLPFSVGLRILPVLLVFLFGFASQQLGVGFSERPGASSLLSRIYNTIGLFFLGGLDLGAPVGGPRFARGILWLSCFLAPAVTASAVLEAAVTAFNIRSRIFNRLSDHVIIGGGGRITQHFLSRLRERDPDVSVVVGEKADRADLDELWGRDAGRISAGDLARSTVLRRVELSRARRVLLLTGDDFTNLEAAARIADLEPMLLPSVIVHVANLRMQRLLESTTALDGLTLINTHQLTAAHLVQSRLLAHFEATEALDAVVIAGFGRFGQTVLDTLQSQAAEALQDIIIIDRDAHRQAAIFDEEIGFCPSHRVRIIEGDIDDPRIWQRARADLEQEEPVFVLGSSDDGTNLQTAMRLSNTFTGARIIALSFHQSRFADHLANTGHFEVVSTGDLLQARISQDWL